MKLFEKINECAKNNQKICILTPNKRLARYVQNDAENYLQTHYPQRYHTTWATPHCLPYSTWLEDCYQKYQLQAGSLQRTLLSATQQRVVWQRHVQTDAGQRVIVNIEQMTQLALQAWENCQLWLISEKKLHEYEMNTDQRIFLQWCRSIVKIYAEQHFIDASQLPAWLATQIQQGPQDHWRDLLPDVLCCFAFDDVTPALQFLLNVLADAGIEIVHYAYESTDIEVKQHHYAQPQSEITAMARWAKQIRNSEPQATIACIHLQLQQKRTGIQKIFTDIFAPEQQHIFHVQDPFDVNISGGQCLTEVPLIHYALDLLQWCFNTLPAERYSALLRCPYLIAGKSQESQRASADRLLRTGLDQACSLSQFCLQQRTLQQHGKRIPAETMLWDRLEKIDYYLSSLASSATHRIWTQQFQTILNIAGWPGDIELNSLQYQQLQHWHKALASFSSLDTIYMHCSSHDAVRDLQHCCQERTFQVESADTPVQVLGLLEAAGIAFDYVWIMGLDNQHFPQAANPNPLLPFRLQQHYACPHATPEREYLFAQHILSRYRLSTRKQLHLSFSELHDDERAQASALIQAYPLQAVIEPIEENRVLLADQGIPLIFDIIEDAVGPTITETTHLRGGSIVLKNYSACYFKGFALHRLAAESPLPFKTLFSPLQRGLHCHAVMENFWNTIKDSQNLHALNPEQQTTLLNKAIDTALKNSLPVDVFDNLQHIISVEKRCIATLLEKWLQQERAREPFSVMATETQEKIAIGVCQLDTRIDRLDRCANGDVVIIDYKTGNPLSSQSWFETRCDDPQLPLYALTHPLSIQGIVYAVLRADRQEYQGITVHNQGMHGTLVLTEQSQYPSWENVKQQWQDNLITLTEHIAEGQAYLNPKYSKQTCAGCSCQMLCRVQEKELHHDTAE